jgi:hypothetical protein
MLIFTPNVGIGVGLFDGLMQFFPFILLFGV